MSAKIKNNSRNRRFKLLLVDDEPDVLYTFQKGLEDSGFEVDAFSDPIQALFQFKNAISTGIEDNNNIRAGCCVYDLVLLDLKMPKMNGFELYREMKNVSQHNRIRACFITGFEEYYNTLKKDFTTLDVKCFIKKPIHIQDLIMEINVELSK
jgi:CheY-like chemotaxis protein